MKYARWRIPLIFAILIVYCCLYFFTGNTWTSFRAVLLSFQFTPTITHIGLPLIIAAIILLVTLFFGRLYCSLLCPAGLIQDVLARMGRWLGLARLRYAKPGKPVLLLSIVALASILGLTSIAVLLDPLGLFGRLALPVGNWYRYWVGETGDWYTYGTIGWLVLIGGAMLLVVVPLVKGRWFCDRLCPVGALLGLMSRLRGKRVVIDSAKCVACGQCGTVCPTRCANPQEKRVDHE